MFALLRRDIIADLLNGRITVEDFYRRLYITAVIVTVAIFALSLVADVAGFNGLNIVLIPVWVIVVGYIGLHPAYLLLALTTGAAASLGRDADRQRVINGMKAALETWKQFFLHGALFGGVFFLTRFLVPIHNYPFAGLVMLGALITLGVWSWLYVPGEARWYRRYALILIFVSLGIGVFGTIVGKPKENGHPMAAMKNSVTAYIDEFRYTDTLELKASSLDRQQLCGVRPGERRFEVPLTVYVLVDGKTNFDLTSYVRVNGRLPDQTFHVGKDGCVDVSYALDGNTKFSPQFIRIKFS